MLNFLQPWANHFPVLLVLIPLLAAVAGKDDGAP